MVAPCESNTAPTDYEYELALTIATESHRIVSNFLTDPALYSANRTYAEPIFMKFG